MNSIMKTLKRIDPFQLGKMLGALYGIMGLLFVPIIFLFSAFGAMAVNQGNHSQMRGAAFGAGMGIGVALLMVVAYAVMGFIGGIIAAFLYNILAKFVGGIRVEVE